MKFPNKVISYKKSIIYKFPIILNELRQKDSTVHALYKKIEKRVESPSEFLDILDCLYYLGEIKFLPESEVIHYVKRDIL